MLTLFRLFMASVRFLYLVIALCKENTCVVIHLRNDVLDFAFKVIVRSRFNVYVKCTSIFLAVVVSAFFHVF